MQEVNRDQIMDSLHQVGVQSGDGLLVHSALQFLGKPQGGVGVYLETLREVIGEEGTIAVPVFNFNFARGEDYDPETTPSAGMGAFSEFVRTQPGVLRTSHPMQSFAVSGKQAAELAACDTLSAFDDNSAVDLMVKNGYTLLLLGATIQASSILHYSEQRIGVPYRYWKEFKGRIRRGGRWRKVTYRMYVRDMAIDARLEIYSVEALLKERNQWAETNLNYGKVSACTLADFVQAASDLLWNDSWCFVTNKPEGGS